jgi:hypothetical protein
MSNLWHRAAPDLHVNDLVSAMLFIDEHAPEKLAIYNIQQKALAQLCTLLPRKSLPPPGLRRRFDSPEVTVAG